MKLILALCLSLFTSVAMACTDFTGRYLDEDSNSYSLQQSGCNSITMTSSDSVETMIADGQYRLMSEDEEVRVMTAANFSGAALILNSRLEYKVALPPEIPAELIPVKLVMVHTKDAAGNLVMVMTVYNSNNDVLSEETSKHQKI